jgi:ADP-ribose pyrophosphatase YjhB (NUDIX family)
VLRRLHALALQVFRRLPVRARRRVVRTIAPGFTVGSICVIERADGAVLLVRQSYRRSWGIPGGLLKRGERPDDAARREVDEEVGLAIELIGEPAVVVDEEARRVDLVYRARPVNAGDTESVTPLSPEITEARWFPIDGLPDLQFETSGALVALARSAGSPQAVPLPAELRLVERRLGAQRPAG